MSLGLSGIGLKSGSQSFDVVSPTLERGVMNFRLGPALAGVL